MKKILVALSAVLCINIAFALPGNTLLTDDMIPSTPAAKLCKEGQDPATIVKNLDDNTVSALEIGLLIETYPSYKGIFNKDLIFMYQMINNCSKAYEKSISAS